MENSITFKWRYKQISFMSFDADKELEIVVENDELDINLYISPNEVNYIISYLANQLKSINEPVDLLTSTTSK